MTDEEQLVRETEELLMKPWHLKRQDDNGNEYIMATFDSRQQAETTMKHYEGKEHKQTYWVEQAF